MSGGQGTKKKKLNIKALEKRVMLDASLGALTTTTVIAEDDANTTPQILDSDVSVTGTTTDFDGDALTISTTGGSEDQLTINNEGTNVGEIGFDGSNVTYGGTLIGTLSSNGVNGSDLVIDLNANASKLSIENLIENITYQNTSDDPTAIRTINFSLAAYFSEDISVTVVAQNEAPTIDTNAALTVNEAGSGVITPALLGISDPDNTDLEVIINVTSSPINGQLELTTNTGVAITSFTLDDLNNNRVVYVHDDSETVSDTFDFEVTDGTDTTPTQTFSITVTPVDEAPVIITNNGADVSQGFTVNLGGEASQFGGERYRESGVGAYNSNQGQIDNQNSIFTLVFTTDNVTHAGNPGQVLFEDGGSGRGIGLYLDSSNRLAWYSGAAASTPEMLSNPLAASTQYSVVVEIDKDSNQLRMHYEQAGNFDWYFFGRTPETELSNYTDTNDLSGGDQGAIGVPGGGSRGGYNGPRNGEDVFQGTIDSDLIVYDFPLDAGTPNTKLVATDIDDTSAELIYIITNDVDYGTLYRDAVALGVNDTFTQADLDIGLVTYENSIGNDDQFTFSLFDGTNTIAGQTYDIRVNTVNNAPTLLTETVIYDEDFEGGTSGWNDNRTTSDSVLSEFWGRFNRNVDGPGDQDLFRTFSLSGTQEYITIDFDFYELDSWDNEYFYVFVDDVQILDNHRYNRATYDTEGAGGSGDVTYNVQELTDGLGWIAFSAGSEDQITTYSITIKTTETDIKLGFGSNLNATNVSDEAFGIDNLRITELGTTGVSRNFQISELTPNNDQVGFANAIEQDIGQDLTYTITGGTGVGIFSVDSATGEIIVADNSMIDYESGTTSYTLTVRATDNGPGLLFDEQTYTINILDALENTSPTFTGTGPYSIAEDALVNDDVGTVTTTDAEGDNVSYVIVNGNADGLFKINANTGLIEIADTTNLDYDRNDQYVIRIRATDDNDLSKYREQNVTINILDVDEAPTLVREDVIETQNAGVFYSSATGNFYQLITADRNFNSALSYSETQLLNGVAGHLATITSAAELAFVDQLTTTHAWIALSDQDTEGAWYFMAGPEEGNQIVRNGNVDHPGYYNNWNGSEPNSGTGRNFALMNNNDRWYDEGNSTRDFVIEWEGNDVINNDTYLVSHSNPDASDVTVGTSIGFVYGLDPEGDSLIYSIQGGNTDGIFEIDSATGELRILDTTNLDATVTDSYILTVRATETIGGKFAEVDITINFNDAISVTTNNPLDVPEGATVAITTADLDITDFDNVASDTLFRVESKPTYGRLELSTYPGYEIATFTYDDLQSGNVVYVHDGSQVSTDSFDFRVTDGGNTVVGVTFNINVIDVNYGPSIDTNTGATVLEGGNVTITQARLEGSDPDIADTPDQLTYTASSLNNGHIEVNGVIQTTFTQEDINNNLVVFVHDGGEGNGSFSFSLADGGEDGAPAATGTFNITKTDVNDAPVITVNNTIDVTEGQTVTITTADLNIVDPDDSGTGIVYTLSNITNGFVELSTNPFTPVISFTQADLNSNRVIFRHDGNEGDASFDISVEDGNEDGSPPATATVNLNKLDVNDAPSVGVNLGSSVNQNSIVIIKNSVLDADDPDDSGVGLIYTVTGTTNGQVELFSNPNVAITSFTQDDIDNSRVVFRHSGPPTTASFDFTLADGGEDSAGTVSDTFLLTVDNVNDAPIIATNVSPTMSEGATLTITTAMLDSFDPDDLGAGLLWTASNLSNGIIQVNGVTQNTFTQADLDAGLVTFVHDDSETTVAGFDIQVEDGGEDGSTPATGSFAINVTPVNEGPTLIVNDGSPNIIDFNDYTIDPFDASQDGEGGDPTSFSISPDGTELTLSGNAWKKVDLPYTLTSDTVLSFEFKTDDVGEIMGIGFDDASGFGSGQVYGYQLIGTQVWSGMDQSFRTYQIGDGWVRFDIPIGQDYTGAMTQLVFVLDDDASPTGSASFRNVNFYESGAEVSIAEGSSIVLTDTYINSADVDDGPFGLTFTASNIENGHIEVGGVVQNNFTQDDIDNARVVFIHDGGDSLTAGFDLSLVDGGEDSATADTGRFDLIITPVDDAPLAATNNGISLNEGATVTITSAELTTSDVDTEPRKVIFDVTSSPANGRLELSTNPGNAISSFTLADINDGRVRFVHDGTETTTDSFDFTVRDETTTLVSDTFSISITPQNDGATIMGDLSLNVLEGGSVTLTTTDLNMVDPDDGASDVTYTVSALSNGQIEVGGVVQSTFTLQDIINGDIVFIHDGSETTSAGFTIFLADGLEHGATADTAVMSITVTPQNDAPTDITLSNMNILETRATGTVIGSFSTTDVDLPGDSFVYSIMADPDSKFVISGNDLLLNNALDYEANTSHTVTIRTDDGNGGTFDKVFTINVGDNVAPTEILLDNYEVEENSEDGTWIANLGVTDSNMPNDTMIYTLMSNPDSMFRISGNQLLVSGMTEIDFETIETVDIAIQVSDLDGNTFDQTFTINILDLDEFSAEAFIEPEVFRNRGQFDFYYIERQDNQNNQSLLQSTLNNRSFGQSDSSNQILRANTTEQIRSILGLEQSIILPLGSIPLPSQDLQQQNRSDQGFDHASDYTNIREAIAFLKDIEDAQESVSDTEINLSQYDINNAFVDVLTYHEQRQEKLRQALSD